MRMRSLASVPFVLLVIAACEAPPPSVAPPPAEPIAPMPRPAPETVIAPAPVVPPPSPAPAASPSAPVSPPAEPSVAEPVRPRITTASPSSVASSSDPYACTAPGDCVIHCPEVAGCCHSACGCRNAINVAQVKAFDASYAKTCRRAPNCLAEGCDYRPAMGATCRSGRCVPMSGLGE